MKILTGTCIFSHDVPRLRAFYQAILNVTPVDDGPGFTAFVMEGPVLSILDAGQMERLAAGSTGACQGGGFSLEFCVESPDAEYARLLEMGTRILKPPTTYPWGRRALWFSDPDGNMISFYQQVKSPEAAAL